MWKKGGGTIGNGLTVKPIVTCLVNQFRNHSHARRFILVDVLGWILQAAYEVIILSHVLVY